jgi:hypothetical protein
MRLMKTPGQSAKCRLAVAAVVVWGACQSGVFSATGPELTEREADFAKRLSPVTLVGQFSIDGKEGAKVERYVISKAEKLKGNQWMITARIQYGDKDVELPVVVDIVWAGDTPVLSLTDLTLPGLGTFTSRVMFHGDRYAGTWQHDAVGGHMWGKLEAVGKPVTKP